MEEDEQGANLTYLKSCLVLLAESSKYFAFQFNLSVPDPNPSHRKRGLMLQGLFCFCQHFSSPLLWPLTQLNIQAG